MNPELKEAYSIDAFRASAHRVVDLLADHLEASFSGAQEQTLPWMEPADSVEHWDRLLCSGMSVEELCAELLARSVRISDPKFMGHQICTPAPTAVIAGFITDCLNNGSGVYEMGMAGTAMEKAVIRTIAQQFGMPSTADGVMTSGGTLANLTAMLAARAIKSGGNDWTEGTQQPLALMVSDQAHYCVDRAARIMGWGDAGIIRVPTDDQYRMRVSELPRLLQAAQADGVRVVAVVGSACSTSTGSFDDLDAIADFTGEHDLWFHVDGAHGAAVAFSQQHRHLLNGIDRADSVVIDFHKMLMTPVINSAVIFRQKEDSFRAFSVEADYLFAKSAEDLDEYNLAQRTFECTKTMLSAKVFSVLAIHGSKVLEANVDQLHHSAREFAEVVEAQVDFELAVQPQTNILCFRFKPPGVSSAELSKLNQRLRDEVIKIGHYYLVKTVLRGETWLRTTIANPFTTKTDFVGLLSHIRSLFGAEVAN